MSEIHHCQSERRKGMEEKGCVNHFQDWQLALDRVSNSET